jgi:hypothetical protein
MGAIRASNFSIQSIWSGVLAGRRVTASISALCSAVNSIRILGLEFIVFSL